MPVYIIALSNGLTFTRTFIRDPYRKHLINAVSNSFDGVSVHLTAYDRDAIGSSLHLHLHGGLPIAFHSAMVLILLERASQSEQWLPVVV